jgi:phosphopantetheinyl transferase (holo-ACP synthase)
VVTDIELLINKEDLKIAVGPLLSELDRDAFSPGEWKRLCEKKRDDQRLQSASALLLARSLMGGETSILHDSSGRPMSSDLSWNLSLSHTSSQVAAGVARAPSLIGVDIENLREARDFSVLRKYVVADGEDLQLFSRFWKIDENKALITLWSLKESFFKALSEDHIPQGVRFVEDSTLSVERLANGKWQPIAEAQVEVQFRGDHVITAISL